MPPVMAVMPVMMMAVAPVIAVAVVSAMYSVVMVVAMAPVIVMMPPMLPVADAVDEAAWLGGCRSRRRCGSRACGHAAQAQH